MKYFWQLDGEVSADALRECRSQTGKEATVAHVLALLENKVPIPPKAYVTPTFINGSDQKPGKDFYAELSNVIDRFERLTHQSLGGRDHPLLLTIQGDYCGAVRNIGCSFTTLPALVHQVGPLAAYAAHVDFVESFSTLILGCPHIDFRKTFGIPFDREKGIDGVKDLSEQTFAHKIKEYQNLVSQKIGKAFIESPENQLLATLIHFAKASKAAGGDELFLHVQAARSQYGQATLGVAYTRNPFTGKRDHYGVYQCGAEGKKGPIEGDHESLKDRFPATYLLLKRYLPKVEECFREVMEVEFVTDEDGHIFFTHFDKAQTTARATVVSAIELNMDGKLTDREAALRLKPADIELLLHPTLDDDSRSKLQDVGSTGVTAAPGTAVGHIFFKMADAMDFYVQASKSAKPKKVILIADELLISDTPGLGIISGLVTKASGIASHAAVMARANGIPCIVGYKGLEIDYAKNVARVNGQVLTSGSVLTLEAGSEGRLYRGEGTLQNLSFREGVIKDVSNLLGRVAKTEGVPLEIRVNINNAKDAEVGLSFGADGVGLCRTENMFMEAKALREIRNIVFTQDPDRCRGSFEALQEIQYEDFKKIFQVMRERVVNIRLMDMPLHDFAPQSEAEFTKLANHLKHLDKAHLRAVAEGLREHNPMLGLRACRFGIITPQVYDMQIRAIVRAAYAVANERVQVNPGIMFPLVVTEAELTRMRARVQDIAEKVREELKVPFSSKITFRVGSMIELPAAAIGADQLARVGEFFAFGTNDLTQTTLGMSRDDSAHYLPMYLEKGILASDPFKVLAEPVRELIEMAVRRGRRVRPDASFGICGEQGGDPTSLLFCMERGLDYVSCSPFRVLPARVALVRMALSSGHTHPRATAPKTADRAAAAAA